MMKTTDAPRVVLPWRAGLGIALALLLLPASARSQDPADRSDRADATGTTNVQPMDYYLRNVFPQIGIVVKNVKINHLGEESFWRHYREGHRQQAMGELIFVLRLVPNHPEALGLLGVLTRDAHDPATAIPYFERAIRLYPSRAYTRAQYGAFLCSVGLSNVGRVYLEEALAMDPELTIARTWLAAARAKDAPARQPAPTPAPPSGRPTGKR